MISLLVALTLATAPAAPPPPIPWRVIDRPGLHLGVRPALEVDHEELAAGVTLQLTVLTPW
jgi:hypothetical protein